MAVKQVEKKKAQDEMRRLMAERKNKDKKKSLINNPLAKYNNSGQLTCVLCSSIVRSEHVWQVHINSKQHRENVEKAKKLKELTNNFTEGKIKNKRASSTILNGPEEKKIKGILKNVAQPGTNNFVTPKNNAPNVYSYHNEEIKRKVILQDNSTKVKKENTSPENVVHEVEPEPEQQSTSAVQPIPEGFFDDPILDAKKKGKLWEHDSVTATHELVK